MTKKTVFRIIYVVSLLLFACACKKNETANNPNCRIITATYTNGTNTFVYNIGYNSEGKPSSITVPNSGTTGGRTIVYNGNTVVSTDRNGMGVVTGSVVVTLNSSNQVTNIRESNNPQGTDWYNTQIIYDGNGTPLREIVTQSGINSPDIYTYTVSNGNIVMITSSFETLASEYHTNKPGQPGDFWNFISLLNYGVSGYRKSNNLLKSAMSSGSTAPTQFMHEMNDKGLISRLRVIGPFSSYSFSYQYACD